MRLIPIVAAASILSISAPAAAQEWTEFAESRRSLHVQFSGSAHRDGDDLDLGVRGGAAGARLCRRGRPEPLHGHSGRLQPRRENTRGEGGQLPSGRREMQRRGAHRRGVLAARRARRPHLCDLDVPAARRPGHAPGLQLHGPRRRTPVASHQRCRPIPHVRVDLHAREQALRPGGHRPCGPIRIRRSFSSPWDGSTRTAAGFAIRRSTPTDSRPRPASSTDARSGRTLLESPATAAAPPGSRRPPGRSPPARSGIRGDRWRAQARPAWARAAARSPRSSAARACRR